MPPARRDPRTTATPADNTPSDVPPGGWKAVSVRSPTAADLPPAVAACVFPLYPDSAAVAGHHGGPACPNAELRPGHRSWLPRAGRSCDNRQRWWDEWGIEPDSRTYSRRTPTGRAIARARPPGGGQGIAAPVPPPTPGWLPACAVSRPPRLGSN